MKKIYWYIIGIGALIVIGIYFGWEIAGVIGGAGALGEYKRNKSKVKDKKKQTEKEVENYDDLKEQNDKKINEAGEDIEKDTFNNSDDAADYVDDALNDISE